MHFKFVKSNLTLPIPIHNYTHVVGRNNVVVAPHTLVSDWLAYIIAKCPCLLGGGGPNLASQLRAFWGMYRWHHPSHEVFSARSEQELAYTVPVSVYGDEGRGLKRANFMVVSWECPLGVHEGPDCPPCDCAAYTQGVPANMVPSFAGPIQETTDASVASLATSNLRGHSYLSRHLLFGCPSWVYKTHPEVCQGVLDVLATDLANLFQQGLQVGDNRFFIALIGCKGDLKQQREFFAELTRSYANLGTKNELMICQHCYAGAPGYNFDNPLDDPNWASTLYAARPWLTLPPFGKVPFDAIKPEMLYVFDLFHVFKLGIGRDLVGSLIVCLCRFGFWDSAGDSQNIHDRLSRAHGSFALYCHTTQRSAALRSFSVHFMNYKTSAAYAWANCKASDTVLLLQWLSWFLAISLRHPPPAAHGLMGFLQTAHATVKTAISMTSLPYKHGVWLRRACAAALYVQIMAVLRGYAHLAEECLNLQVTGFAYKPKYHALHHIAHNIRMALQTASPRVLSPVVFSCDSCEDLVGRASRLSRRVSVRSSGRRVMERVFLKTRAVLRRHLAQRRQQNKWV